MYIKASLKSKYFCIQYIVKFRHSKIQVDKKINALNAPYTWQHSLKIFGKSLRYSYEYKLHNDFKKINYRNFSISLNKK